MDPGLFSVRLTVEDLSASRRLCEAPGFEVAGGDRENYVIMRNGSTLIGLFHGMFERNILTETRWTSSSDRMGPTSPPDG